MSVAPLPAHLLEEEVVHQAYELHVPRQHRAQHVHGPLLHRLGHDRVVRVIEDLLRQLPGVLLLQALHVDQDAHQLRNGDGGVRVVQLDLHLLVIVDMFVCLVLACLICSARSAPMFVVDMFACCALSGLICSAGSAPSGGACPSRRGASCGSCGGCPAARRW